MNLYVAGGCAVALVLALGVAHHSGGVSEGRRVQALWDAEKLDQAKQRDQQLSTALSDASKARAETEVIRQNYIEFKAGKQRETDDLERAVAAGNKRLSVKASCPATAGMSSAGTPASGTATGTAILDADVGRNYYAYRRAYDAQFATLKLCRDELIKRSAK